MQVKNVMTRAAVTITENTSLREVRELMKVFQVTHVPVLRGRELVGVVTEARVLGAAAGAVAVGAGAGDGGPWEALRAGEVMARQVVTVGAETHVEHALHAAWPAESGSPAAGFLAVEEGGEIVGVVATADLRAALDGPAIDAGPRLAHVLAPLALAPADHSALESAVRVAREHHARLTLLHVLPGPWRHVVEGGVPRPIAARIDGARRRMALDRLMAMHPREPGANWLVAEGEPGVEIVRTATRHHVDLIVLGGHRSPGGGARGDSATAAYVIDRAPCRVHVVRGAYEA